MIAAFKAFPPHHENEVRNRCGSAEDVTAPFAPLFRGGKVRKCGKAEVRDIEVRSEAAGKTTLGIDLGATGAVALLDQTGALLTVEDLPVIPDGAKGRPTISAALLADLLRRWQPDRAFVEFVAARPTDSKVGAFAFGKARGCVEAVLATLGIPFRSITAPTWKRAVNIPPGTGQKNTARAEAIRRWPAHAASFARVKDDGRAEAALIAVAGMAREAQGR